MVHGLNMTMIFVAIVSHVFHSRMYTEDACEHSVGRKLENISMAQHSTCLEKSLDDIRERVTDIADIIALGMISF